MERKTSEARESNTRLVEGPIGRFRLGVPWTGGRGPPCKAQPGERASGEVIEDLRSQAFGQPDRPHRTGPGATVFAFERACLNTRYPNHGRAVPTAPIRSVSSTKSAVDHLGCSSRCCWASPISLVVGSSDRPPGHSGPRNPETTRVSSATVGHRPEAARASATPRRGPATAGPPARPRTTRSNPNVMRTRRSETARRGPAAAAADVNATHTQPTAAVRIRKRTRPPTLLVHEVCGARIALTVRRETPAARPERQEIAVGDRLRPASENLLAVHEGAVERSDLPTSKPTRRCSRSGRWRRDTLRLKSTWVRSMSASSP